MSDDEIFLTIIGPESVMKDLENISIDEVEIDTPQPLDAMVDAVDAPLGTEEFQTFLMHATVVLKFGIAATQFGLVSIKLAEELKKLLTRVEPHEKPQIRIVNAKTNAPIMEITEKTDTNKAGDLIKKEIKK